MIKIIIIIFSISVAFAQLKTGSGGIWESGKDGTSKIKDKRTTRKQKCSKELRSPKETWQQCLAKERARVRALEMKYKNEENLLNDIQKSYKKSWLKCYKDENLKFSLPAQLSQSMTKVIIIENSEALKKLSANNSFKKKCSQVSTSETKKECKGNKELDDSLTALLKIEEKRLHRYFTNIYDMADEEAIDLIEVLEAFKFLNNKDNNE